MKQILWMEEGSKAHHCLQAQLRLYFWFQLDQSQNWVGTGYAVSLHGPPSPHGGHGLGLNPLGLGDSGLSILPLAWILQGIAGFYFQYLFERQSHS